MPAGPDAARRRPSLGWLPWLFAAGLPPVVLVAIHLRLVDEARWWFDARLLYWTMPVVVVFALAAGVARWRAATTPWRQALRQSWPGLALAIGLTAAVVATVPPRLRVQFDETSLVNTSQTMQRVRAAMMVTGCVFHDGGVVALENTIDKRPPLFAFLVSVLHDVAGERIANAFAVNAGLLAVALFLAWACARRLGVAAAAAAPVLLLAVPLVVICATSAGFDLLAALLFGLALLTAADFVAQPDDVRGVAFVAAGMLFAQSRYESAFAFVLLAVLVAWRARHWRPGLPTRLAIAACPTLVTPLALLLQIARNPNFYPEAGGGPLVSLGHFTAHVGPLLAQWFWPLFDNALPGVVAIAAVAAWVARWVRRRGDRGDLLLLAPVLAVTGVVLAWFSGDVRDAIALRLYLPLALLCALSPLLFVATFGRRCAPWLGVAALALAVWRLDGVRRDEVFPRLDGERVLAAVERQLAHIDADRRTTLWVSTIAQHLVTTGRAAMSPQTFERARDALRQHVAAGDVGAIYLVETPFDEALAGGFGDPRRLLGGRPVVVARETGDLPITVYRLR